ncbi:MAG: homoserine kinase [Alphaproteobacteria bacterium]|nr:homoserine kinase [Alphaproteobacteria bacterium]
MAVYTPVGEDALERFLAGYRLGSLQRFEPIPEGIDNTNYLLEASSGRYVLTLFENRLDQANLMFFVDLMDYLSARDIPCPVPIRRINGVSLTPLAGRTALIVTFLEGEQDPSAFRAIGEALARLHLAGTGFPSTRINDLGLEGWRHLAAQTSCRADDLVPGLAERIADTLTDLSATWPEGLPSGAIHADLFPDNAVFRKGLISGIYDFYFACTDAFAYDLAITQVAWVMDPEGRFDAAAAVEVEKGYEAIRPLEAAESLALPVLRRGAALRFLLTRLYDWLYPAPAAVMTLKDPLEYLRKLDGLS